jgi:hypothetical protein
LGSYSEIATDAYILREVGDAKNITIFECPYCANQSLAYSKNVSEIGKISLFGFRFEPYPMGQEANRIKELLESKGKTANVKYFNLPQPPYCQLDHKARSRIAKAYKDSDAAIALKLYSVFWRNTKCTAKREGGSWDGYFGYPCCLSEGREWNNVSRQRQEHARSFQRNGTDKIESKAANVSRAPSSKQR